MARKKGGVAEVRNPQEDAFLRSIIENPKDDTPRLVYADWLQERDDPHGEFIRCQVEAHRKTTPAAQKRKFKQRADELLKEHNWLPSYFDREETKVERGFVTVLGFDGNADIPADEELGKLASLPFFALTARYWNGEIGRQFSILVRLPRLGCLGKIDWSSTGFGNEDLDPDEPENPLAPLFLSSPHLAGLRELRLANVGLHDKSVIALAKNPAAANLRILNIGSDGGMEVSGNFFKDKGLKALCESPYLGELEELDLGDSWIGDKGIGYLCESTGLPKLKKLFLKGVTLSAKGYRTLAESPFAAQLEELLIGKGYYQSQNLPGDAGAMALAESPHLEKIKKLEIHLGELSTETVAALRRRFGKRVVLPYVD